MSGGSGKPLSKQKRRRRRHSDDDSGEAPDKKTGPSAGSSSMNTSGGLDTVKGRHQDGGTCDGEFSPAKSKGTEKGFGEGD